MVDSGDAESLLNALDPEQRQAAETLLGPVCILAGAGTGKTRAITHRIAYGVASGVYSPSRIMALTFTNRAAGELRSRLRSLGAPGVQARTFHATALAQLGYFWPRVVGGHAPRVVSGKARLLGQAASELSMRVETATLRDVAAEIEWRKVQSLNMFDYERRLRGVGSGGRRYPPQPLEEDDVIELMNMYERLKDERRQLDFEDVLLATAGMLENEPTVIQQVREQYRFFVVDEYQDVSPLQHQLLKLWLGDRDDVCVVGDAAQTIYSFTGASREYLLGFAQEFPRAQVVELHRNYRSRPEIVQLANQLMRSRDGAVELNAVQDSRGIPPTIAVYDSDAEEAQQLADSIIHEIANGRPAQDIAVLFRINAQAALIESALAAAGVPTRVAGATRFFERSEVRQAILALRAAAVAGNQEPLFKTVSDVLRGLGWTQNPPHASGNQVGGSESAGPVGGGESSGNQFNRVDSDRIHPLGSPSASGSQSGAEVPGAVRERWEALNAIMVLADAEPPGTELKSFAEELRQREQNGHEPEREAVTLATFHSAKGLEWPSVYLLGLSEGLLPISYADTLEAVAEERRLFYVAITRAREQLKLSWSRGARAADSVHESAGETGRPTARGSRAPSRFLEELGIRTPPVPGSGLAAQSRPERQ